MFRLAWWLLPYAMVLGGALVLIHTVPVVIGGGEKSPTSVLVSDITVDAPKARWLTITGGGLYLADAIVNERITRSRTSRKIETWYVPLVTDDEVIDRAKSMVGGTERPLTGNLVLVVFGAEEFLQRYSAPDNLKPDEVFRPVAMRGLRSSSLLLPERVKDYVRTELGLPLESVVVVRFGRRPMQRDQAKSIAANTALVTLVGTLWVVKRFRARPAPPPSAA